MADAVFVCSNQPVEQSETTETATLTAVGYAQRDSRVVQAQKAQRAGRKGGGCYVERENKRAKEQKSKRELTLSFVWAWATATTLQTRSGVVILPACFFHIFFSFFSFSFFSLRYLFSLLFPFPTLFLTYRSVPLDTQHT